jgi:hypothetical protein
VARKINVFLMFEANQRNSFTSHRTRTTTIEPGPNWPALVAELKGKGYDLTVDGPPSGPTVQALLDTLAAAEATVLVGHGGGSRRGGKFVADQLKLRDGLVQSPTGILRATWNQDKSGYTPAANAAWAKPRAKAVTAIFTCNSDTELPKAFGLAVDGHLVTNDGGDDGVTRIGTLEQAAYDFIRKFVSSGSVGDAMQAAQMTFNAKGARSTKDKGDTLHIHNVGTAPKF